MQFDFTYDGKNDRHEISYKGAGSVQLVYVGGRAMSELSNSNNIGVKEQQDVGTAIAKYLTLKNITSLSENPIFILPEIDIEAVNNALAITPELLEICQKHLNQ